MILLPCIFLTIFLSSNAASCPSGCKCNQDKSVSCTKAKLTEIPENIPSDTEKLNLRENEISEISISSFNYMHELKSIDLSRNHLKIIPENVFQNLTKLKMLQLGENEIVNISGNSFNGLQQLERLVLGINKLKKITGDLFKNVKSLKKLDLSANYFHNIPPFVFVDMKNLEELEIYDNEVKFLHNKTFGSLPKLTLLDFSFSYIEYIEPGTFDNLPELNTLALQDNEISIFQKGTFNKLKNVEYLFLNSRTLNCTCDFIREMNIQRERDISIEIEAWCVYPLYLRDREVKWIDNAEMKNC